MSTVDVEDREQIRWIVFNRPEKRNALRETDLQQIESSVTGLGPDIRAIIFRGSGYNFSSGSYVEQFLGFSIEASYQHIQIVARALAAVRQCTVPTIACIEGYCFGLAFDLALVCDLRVAADDAVFCMPELNLGLPCVMDISLLQRHIGISRAKELILTGDRYPAHKLFEWGFINKITEAVATENEAVDLARRLTSRSASAMAAQKRLFEAWIQMSHDDASHASLLEYALNYANADTAKTVRKHHAAMQSASTESRGGQDDA